MILWQVLDAGEIVEFDEPYVLMQNSNGLFKRLVSQTGNQMETQLLLATKEAYFKKHHNLTLPSDNSNSISN